MPTGFVDRIKGKIMQSSASLTQMGKGTGTFLAGGLLSKQQFSTGLGLSTTAGPAGVETTLASYVLPPNSMDSSGRNIQVVAYGLFTSSTNPTGQTVKLYFGSQAISQAASTTAGSATSWELILDISKSGTSQQVIAAQSIGSTTHQGVTVSTGTENDTVGSTIKVTALSSAAIIPSSIVIHSLKVEGQN